MRVGIVGGGITGLVTAYELSKKGHQIYLFESDEILGGLAQSIDFSGNKIDKFYRHIFKSDIDIIDLIDELKLKNKLKWIESNVGFFYNGKIYKFTTPIDLLKFKPLPFIDRIKTGIMTLYLQKVKDWKKYENITAKEWIEKYVGKKVYEVIWGPLLYQKFGDKAEKISMTWLYGRIHARLQSREKGGAKEVLGYMEGSFQTLINTLESEITKEGSKIFKGTSVNKVIVENNEVKGIKIQGKTYNLDCVIITSAPKIAEKLVDELDDEYKKKLESIEYYGSVALIMRTKKSLSDFYWINIADKNSPFTAIVEHTNFMPKEEYNNNHIIYLGKYLSTQSELYKKNSEEIKKVFFDYLRNINPLFKEEDVLEWRIYREPFTQPVVFTNYSKIMPEYRTNIKKLYIGNMSQIYPEDRGMSYSVKLGKEIANLVNNDNKELEE